MLSFAPTIFPMLVRRTLYRIATPALPQPPQPTLGQMQIRHRSTPATLAIGEQPKRLRAVSHGLKAVRSLAAMLTPLPVGH
mmetsp:Transcript_86914/g.151261  ORF Transcript_86914/g.151261 Transcript_86914/m.151261 type:complete len:81 (-) Transcript_86914:93-335(-)